MQHLDSEHFDFLKIESVWRLLEDFFFPNPSPLPLYYSFYKYEIKKWCAQIILVTLLVSTLSLDVFWAFRGRQHELGKNYFKSAPLLHLENCTKMATKKLLQKPNKYQNWGHIDHKIILNITTQKHIFPMYKVLCKFVGLISQVTVSQSSTEFPIPLVQRQYHRETL